MSIRVSYRIQRLVAGATLVSLLGRPLAAQGTAQPTAPAAQATDAAGFERVVLTAGRSTVSASCHHRPSRRF